MAWSRALLAIFLFFLSGAVLGQRYGFEALSVEEGLPQAGVYDMIQGPDGALWIATEGGGVARYDGRVFRVFDTDSGLPDNVVRCLAFDSSGLLVGGTASGGIFFLKNDSAYVPEGLSPLTSMHIRGVAFAPDSALWISTLDNGIFVFEGDELRTIEPDFAHAVKCRDIVCGTDGTIWVATDKGLAYVKNKKLTLTEVALSASKLFTEPVLDLFVTPEGGLWVATEDGVYRIFNNKSQPLLHSDMTGRRVRSVAADSRGYMWFGTELGLFRMRVAGDMSVSDVRFFDRTSGLTNERIRKVLVDDNQLLWVGTYFGGVLKLQSEAFAAFGPTEGIDRGNVTCMTLLPDGRMAVAYFGGRIMLSDLSGRSTTTAIDLARNSDMRINRLLPLADGQLMACTGFGTFLINTSTGRTQVISTHWSTDAATLGGKVWVSATDGLHCLDRGVLSSACGGSFTALLAVGDSMLLAGDGKNILAIRHPKCGMGCKLDTLARPGAALTGGLALPDGSWWLATDGEGVFIFKNNKVRSAGIKQFLPTAFITSLEADANGLRFAGSKKGLTLLETDSENKIILQSYHFDSSKGLPGKEISRNALLAGPDGALWVGTVSGLQSFHPSMLHSDPTAPVLRLGAVLLNYEPMSDADVKADHWQGQVPWLPVFGHRQNHLTFKAEAIDLSGPDAIRFQMMLVGHDEDWLPASPGGEITYAQLKPGDYVFRFRAANKDGVWNETPFDYPFTIQAPFYAAWWFITVVVMLAVLLIWGIFRLRLAMLRKENLLLEAKVRERTGQLAREKEKSDELLLNILPRSVADELKEKGSAAAQKHQVVTVLFSDFKGFTSLTETLSSDELVAMLHQYFTAFDSLCADFGVEKIKTIGDAYMCATGLPQSDPDHAEKMVLFAKEMIRMVHRINRENERHGIPPWLIRIGIHSGPVIAGVVGHRKFAYDIWGDTVNIASRMESNGEPFQINVSEETKRLLGPQFRLSPRGKIEVKNKGPMDMYFVEPNDNRS